MYLVIDLVNNEVVKKSADGDECVNFIDKFCETCDIHESDRFVVVVDNLKNKEEQTLKKYCVECYGGTYAKYLTIAKNEIDAQDIAYDIYIKEYGEDCCCQVKEIKSDGEEELE